MNTSEEQISKIMDDITAGEWPQEPVIPVAVPFTNESGEIWNLAWGKFESASLVCSRAGSVRSNHYHNTDWHFLCVASGVMYYYQRQHGSSATPLRRRCPSGTLIFTPPGFEHATFFPVETTVVTLQRNRRDKKSHEEDLVRVSPLVTKETCPAVFDGVHCVLPWQHVEGRDFRNPIHAGDHETADGRIFNFG